jgi:hypothetical protein
MPGRWHLEMQEMFPQDKQEVKFSFIHMSANDTVTERTRWADVCVEDTVIEYQHSRITLEEVSARHIDYTVKAGKRLIWVIDCTENTTRPRQISDAGEEEVWLVEFEKKWHVKSMRDSIVFADFGDRIFRIPVAKIAYRMVTVFGSFEKGPGFVEHLMSPIEPQPAAPSQSVLTVAQDPHGSGKTYKLTRMMLYTDEPEFSCYAHYRTFIVVTKPHSAKNVVYAEFEKHLRLSDCEVTENEVYNKKYIVKFKRANGDQIMCIFGTVDSLMVNLADNKENGPDTNHFVNLVRTIHRHGPTKLQGPRGRFSYGGEQPQLNAKTLLVTDEATMLPDAYADAFATLMRLCHVDVHLAGDVQQSTYYEHNLLTKVITSYERGTTDEMFPDATVKVHRGNQVRRFNKRLVEFRNIIMQEFHSNPTHNLNIDVPEAATDVSHARGEFSIDTYERIAGSDDPESDGVQTTVEQIMRQFQKDTDDSVLLPSDVIIVTPFVTNNPLMDALQTAIHDFWTDKLQDDDYIARVGHREEFHEVQRVSDRLQWYCVLHRSEEGKPIDTTQSRYSTRIVSVHASQGDGRRFAYVVGMTERALTHFSAGRVNLKYESLMNVAFSRMTEVVRVYLEQTYDDVWRRFLPLMSQEIQDLVVPIVHAKKQFCINSCGFDSHVSGLPDLFQTVKSSFIMSNDNDSAPLVDYAHHVVRMMTAHTVFYLKATTHLLHHVEESAKEQLLVVLKKITQLNVQSMASKQYYRELRLPNHTCIPVLYYNTGASNFHKVHKKICDTIRNVQADLLKWIRGAPVCLDSVSPVKAVLLQYCIGLCTWGDNGRIKMDTVYDVIDACSDDATELAQHYEYIRHIASMFDQIIKDNDCSWKIQRSLGLGTETGDSLDKFDVKLHIPHLYVTDTEAMPILLVSDIDDMSIPTVCAQALIYTLVCRQPEECIYQKIAGKPTWEYVKGKTLKICIVSLKGHKPFVVDLCDFVEQNLDLMARWVCEHIRQQTEVDIAQVVRVTAQYGLEKTRQAICRSYKKGNCPEYMYQAIDDVESHEEVERELHAKLKKHLKRVEDSIKRRSG